MRDLEFIEFMVHVCVKLRKVVSVCFVTSAFSLYFISQEWSHQRILLKLTYLEMILLTLK